MSFRRLFLATAFLHLAGFSAAAGAADGRPNVVVVMADDCTFRDLGTYGGQAATPNLDRLAAEGMLFERCFQSAPMCSPTRHALYTGLEPVRSGAYPNHTRVYPDVKCVVQYLHDLDYTVHLSGKSHVSPPQVFAWDTATGGNGAGNNPDMAEIDKLFAGRAAGEKPFCLFAMSNEPHGPWDKGDPSAYPPSSLTVPPHLADTPLLRHIYSKYLAEITYFDGQVGQILDLLDRHGLADDTLVIVLSEQGDGFTAAKWFCYDNSLQSGLIVRWPGRIAAGTRTDAMVGYIDIVPTIVEAAGGKAPPEIDGRSFLGVLSGSATSHRDLTFGLQTTRGIHNGSDAYAVRTVRSDRYRLVWNLNHDAEFSNAMVTSGYFLSWEEAAAAGDEHAKFVVERHRRRPEWELYDVEADPYSLNNIADDPAYADTISELRSELEGWMRRQGDEGIETELRAFERQGKRRAKAAAKKKRRRES